MSVEEEPSRADPWTAAFGTSSAITLAQLCKMLADKGAIDQAGVEILRHSALGGFDEVQERATLSKPTLGALEAARTHLESLWQKVALAAEDRERGSK